MPLALMLLCLMFHIPTPRAPMLPDLMLHALTAATIDVMIVWTAAGMTDEMIDGRTREMTDETLAMMFQVTTAEVSHTSTEIETVVGPETINGCIATTCILALVAVVSGD